MGYVAQQLERARLIPLQIIVLPIGANAVRHTLDDTPDELDLTDIGLQAVKNTASELELDLYPSIPLGTSGTGVQNILVSAAEGKFELLRRDGNFK